MEEAVEVEVRKHLEWWAAGLHAVEQTLAVRATPRNL